MSFSTQPLLLSQSQVFVPFIRLEIRSPSVITKSKKRIAASPPGEKGRVDKSTHSVKVVVSLALTLNVAIPVAAARPNR